jgi:oligoendopeptidase F
MTILGTLPTWDLTHLYKSLAAPEITQDIEAAKQLAQSLVVFQGKLAAQTPMQLLKLIETYEKLDDVLGKLISYAGLAYAGDAQNAEIMKFYGDISGKITDISSEVLFFTLELNSLPEALIEDQALAHFSPWLQDLRKEKPHQLEDKLEQLFLEKHQTGAQAWNRLFDETMVKLKFSFEGQELGLEALLNYMQDKDAAKREAASKALSKTLKENIGLFTLITNTLAKDKAIADKWRGFKDVAAARNLNNRIEDEVVNALVESVVAAYPRLSHRYYALKAKWFGVEKLASWDRNAPLPLDHNRIYTWEEAKTIIIEAFGGFSPLLAATAKRFFDENWIDAPVREGKSSGAFAHPTTPSAHPYILVNFQGKARDVMTLAHELGHGVHQVLAGKQGALMAPTPLTLAETASVFGEMLTFKAMVKTAQTPDEKKALLAGKVEDMINTVVRQIAFYHFERKVHLARQEGELTSEAINTLWLSVQEESLGQAIDLKEGYEVFWAYIPHFIHSPFYVYAYAFGDCLVNSLYAVYQQQPEGFVPKYHTMLEAGGTQHHSTLLAPFGLNAAHPSFWNNGLQLLETMIDELEAMA